MTAPPAGWRELPAELAPRMPPEWTHRAREHAGQAWIRLIQLVDAQRRLSALGIDEKIATTMAELAEEREAERKGSTAVMERAREKREECLARLRCCPGSNRPSSSPSSSARSSPRLGRERGRGGGLPPLPVGSVADPLASSPR